MQILDGVFDESRQRTSSRFDFAKCDGVAGGIADGVDAPLPDSDAMRPPPPDAQGSSSKARRRKKKNKKKQEERMLYSKFLYYSVMNPNDPTTPLTETEALSGGKLVSDLAVPVPAADLPQQQAHTFQRVVHWQVLAL